MGAEITTKNCDMTMDASGEDAYVYAAADSVKIDGGKFKAKATSAVVGTDNVTYVSGDASSVDAMTTVVSECSEDYKDTYTEDDLASHPKASVLKTKKYIEVDTVPMYAYMYDATAKKLYQVSDDETNKVELVGSTMPTGLAIEDDKLKMNDFRFTTANDVILKVEGDGTIYVEGTNNYLCNRNNN